MPANISLICCASTLYVLELLGEAKVCYYADSIPHTLCIKLSGEAKICYYVDSNSHTEMIHTEDAHKIKGSHISHL